MQKAALLMLVCLAVANADIYMQSMRGSNNRLNEANAERNNGDRLFDSQVPLPPFSPFAASGRARAV